MIGGVIKGQATYLEIQAKEVLKTHTMSIILYVEATELKLCNIEQA